MSAYSLRPPRRSGGWVVLYRRRVIFPPAPRASAIVDPRIGDLGPALLALEDGTVFGGVAFGAPVSRAATSSSTRARPGTRRSAPIPRTPARRSS